MGKMALYKGRWEGTGDRGQGTRAEETAFGLEKKRATRL